MEIDRFSKEINDTILKIEKSNMFHLVNNSNVYFGTDSTNKIKLKQLVDSPKLMFYFSSNTCSPCIEETIEIMKEIFPNYEETDKIVFVSPDYPARYRNNCYGKKLLILDKNKLGLPIENGQQSPFFLIINKNLQVQSMHVVNKMDFSRTKEYLKDISYRSLNGE
ncbi:MAG: hypothetical protein VB102_07615 [Paludibacter sp.]|nr:hypothetical protein [Paludibacter sp.]